MANVHQDRRKKILILSPFFESGAIWIDDFCDRPDFQFEKIPYLNESFSWHSRGRTTPLGEWISHFRYTRGSLRGQPDCVITCFPQLALIAAGLLMASGSSSTRLIAWTFNLGSLPSGWKRYFASAALRRVDRFVVHSRGEIVNYANWLGYDQARFAFVPLQRGKIPAMKSSPIPKPYIVSMGSANRDYGTLVKAVLGTGIKMVIVSKRSIVEGLPDHPDLIKLHGLTPEECDSILHDAEINVVPIVSTLTAAGQVTFTTSMRMGVATIATRCIGTVDYIQNGETGILVSPGDAEELGDAVRDLWQNRTLRLQMASAGRDYANKFFSDEAAGDNLSAVIDGVI